MRPQKILIVIVLITTFVTGIWVGSSALKLGSLDSQSDPANTKSYTLADIYNRLSNGTIGAESSFTEPASGPVAGTGYTLNEIMAKAPLPDNTNGVTAAEVPCDRTFWGLNVSSGEWGVQTGTASCNPNIRIEKSTNGNDSDVPPGSDIAVDTPIEWTYSVKNTGDADLHDISVTDDREGNVNCPCTSLSAGESMTCTISGTAQAGLYSNEATVSAESNLGSVSDSDKSHYNGVNVGSEGCTVGYWKNHPEEWAATGYATSQSIVSVFSMASGYTFGSSTLLDALDFGGGIDLESKARILVSAGVAALLNASHPSVAYPMVESQVVTSVDAALASANISTIVAATDALQAYNNLGCPL
jgi:hypothetical protein